MMKKILAFAGTVWDSPTLLFGASVLVGMLAAFFFLAIFWVVR